jgi:hypothetical protein
MLGCQTILNSPPKKCQRKRGKCSKSIKCSKKCSKSSKIEKRTENSEGKDEVSKLRGKEKNWW